MKTERYRDVQLHSAYSRMLCAAAGCYRPAAVNFGNEPARASRRVLLTLTLLSAGGFESGCRLLFGLEEGKPDGSSAPTPNDEAGDATATDTWWTQVDNPGCPIASRPEPGDRPDVGDAPSLEPFYMALTKLRIGEVDENFEDDESAWKDIGFDIDGHCTGIPACGTRNGTACFNSSAPEGNACRDNAIGSLMHLAKNVAPTLTEAWLNCRIWSGGFNVVFKVSDYNGNRDDPQVRVDVYTSIGVARDPFFECFGGNDPPPRWTEHANWWQQAPTVGQPGGYLWRIIPESLESPASRASAADAGSDGRLPNARVFDAAAFVRSGYLFAAFPDVSTFWLNGLGTEVPGFRTIISRGFILGRLKLQNERWTLVNATLAGITRKEDMIQGFAEVGVCNPMDIENITGALTAALDMPLDGEGDPDMKCTALSIGWDFEAHQTGGGILDYEWTAPPPCPGRSNPPDAGPR